MLNFLIFGSANKAFESEKDSPSGFEWLSRDEAEVKKYMDDDLCGFVPFPASLQTMFDGIKLTQQNENIANIDATKPVYLFSGTADPVNKDLSNIERMLAAWRKYHIQPDTEYFEDGRHEMLNETNKQEVIDKLIRWLTA